MLKVLEGIRMLEVAEWFFVPGAGTVLADWGVDVIKVEHPTRGESITIVAPLPNSWRGYELAND